MNNKGGSCIMEEKKEPTIVDISFHDEICITPPEKK
jgi:hypothetical protein